MIIKMINQPFDEVKEKMAAGTAKPSVVSDMMERIYAKANDNVGDYNKGCEPETVARYVSGAGFGAAADTTSAATQAFFVAMSLYPDIQKKAQEEVDRVVGPRRLPNFEDYDRLVYVKAIILETLRWLPVLPMGVPHVVTHDDEYKGFFIPKDATIIPNLWAMLHNPEEYPDPKRFNPDRYIKDGNLHSDIRNPLTMAFGFGRRICPGRWLVDTSLFITVASILYTFDIHPILGPEGKKFDPFTHNIDGINLVWDDLPCTLVPRSERAQQLIREANI